MSLDKCREMFINGDENDALLFLQSLIKDTYIIHQYEYNQGPTGKDIEFIRFCCKNGCKYKEHNNHTYILSRDVTYISDMCIP